MDDLRSASMARLPGSSGRSTYVRRKDFDAGSGRMIRVQSVAGERRSADEWTRHRRAPMACFRIKRTVPLALAATSPGGDGTAARVPRESVFPLSRIDANPARCV